MNPPELPDIHLLIEELGSAVGYLPDVPDWLWQGVAVNLLTGSVWVALKHRKKIAEKLRLSHESVLLSGIAVGRSSARATITVSSERQALYDVLSTVGSERQAPWNVETSTASLTERLAEEGIELLSWYLRQR